jgi:RNA polymerase sigma factor for flagellar operon FliA
VATKSTDKVSLNVTEDVRTDALAREFIEPSKPASNPLHGTALKAYGQQARQVNEDKRVLEFLPMVHKIVHQVTSYLHPPLTREDLVSAGTIGLIKAARDFDPSRDVEFKTYAYIRIRGAVIDELRGWSFAPSNVKRQFDKAQLLMREMIEKHGHIPSDDHLAEKLGISVEKLYRLFENARARHFLSIHGITDDSPTLDQSLTSHDTEQPGDSLERAELAEKLSDAIAQLPEKQRQIVILYYHKEMTMKEIALVLKVTESRISQLHAGALFKLSVKLRRFSDVEF